MEIRKSVLTDYTDLLPLIDEYIKELPDLRYTRELLISIFQQYWYNSNSGVLCWTILKEEVICGFLTGYITQSLQNNVALLTFHILACKMIGGNLVESKAAFDSLLDALTSEGISNVTLSIETGDTNDPRIRLFGRYGFRLKYMFMELEGL